MKTQIDQVSDVLASEMGAFADLLTAAADNAQLLSAFYTAWEKVEAVVDGDVFEAEEEMVVV